MEELYEDKYGAISIATDFLNDYLCDTKSEYLKVFLFYLWKGIKEHWIISDVANEIDLDEHTVEMALRFWIKKGIFKKDCLVKSKNANVPNSTNFYEKKSPEHINEEQNNEVQNNEKQKNAKNNFEELNVDTSKDDKEDYDKIKDGLRFYTMKVLGQPPTDRQLDLIEKCYDVYNFDVETIYYLVEFCRDEGKTDARYMAAVASSWFEQKIKNVSEAKMLTMNIKSGVKTKNPKIVYNPNIKIVKGRDGKKTAHNLEKSLDANDNYDRIILDSVLKKDFK